MQMLLRTKIRILPIYTPT